MALFKKKKDPFLAFATCVLAIPTGGILTGALELADGRIDAATLPTLMPWLTVGVLLGFAHLFLRPILRLLSAPIGCLTLGLFGFAIDVGLIYLCAFFVEGFAVPSLTFAVLTAILVNAICAVVN